ncbi:hypothetical protein [uncultured Tenacibaculum sp.]|uniref:hypothetical protein n=1 Tax=uncultured Tenacibaculum sp. TaxID=174713 RepID=UPI00262F8284|nr:hypothetical protein [uncultured Tenacibaculum sp.]
MKRVYLKTTNINYHSLIGKFTSMLFLILIIISCSKKDDVEALKISQEIKELIYFKGNESASTVLINSQGGPGYQLDEGTVNLFFQGYNTDDVLMANVHQAQTKNLDPFTNNDLTLEQAVNFNAESVENLFRTIQFFKDQGRTVYVLGVSYGAFLTQQLIAKHGINVADKYIILTGRLDINDEIWQGAAEGKDSKFINAVTPDIAANPGASAAERNTARLFAGIAKNRYTQNLRAINDLSNLMYVYGKNDNAVGRLTSEEIQFLQTRNASIISGNGNHDETYEDLIVDAIKDFFGIAPK